MNKAILIVSLLILQAYSHPMHNEMMDYLESLPAKQQFKLWHYAFDKPYDLNSDMAIQKYKTFKSNLKIIKEENAKTSDYKLGLGPFTDLSAEEFLETYANLKVPEGEVSSFEGKQMNFDELAARDDEENDEPIVKKSNKFDFDTMADDDDDDHDDVRSKKRNLKKCDDSDSGDSRDNSDSSSSGGDEGCKDWSYLWPAGVKDQGACGSCWAFATIGVIEAFANIELGITEKLSEQHPVDCDTRNHACNGGWYTSAFNYLGQAGLFKESDYPYVARKQTCQTECKTPFLKYKKFKYCTNNGSRDNCKEGYIDQFIAEGPYATAIHVDPSLAHYRQGKYLPKYCTRINHAVIVVQYCPKNNKIKIRNSWGSRWGEEGYGYINIDHQSVSGMKACGALEHAFAPNSFEKVK